MSNEWAKRQLTSEEAIKLFDSKVWEDWSDETIVRFQLFQKCLAMPFSRFHEAVTNVLGRPVYTHEFAFHEELIKEYLGEKEMPTLDEIINLMPAEKLIILKL